MNIIFVCAYYYKGPVHYLGRVFEIFKALGRIFQSAGISIKYFAKENKITPSQDTINEQQFNELFSGCDLLFMWNASLGKEKEIAEKCRAQGKPIYFAELGWLPQRGTFYFDQKGVNYASTITDWQYKPLTEKEKEIIREKIALYHKHFAQKTGIMEKDFVFVPLQVENDSQIKNYSPIKKMQKLIDCVCENVGGKIIFKTHPHEKDIPLKCPDRCKIYRHGTTHDFLPNCDYVITINSTVGIEALTYNKPVITLGQALYGRRGLTRNLNAERITLPEINEAFLYYLFQRQWNNADLNDRKKILGLLEEIKHEG